MRRAAIAAVNMLFLFSTTAIKIPHGLMGCSLSLLSKTVFGEVVIPDRSGQFLQAVIVNIVNGLVLINKQFVFLSGQSP